MICDTFMFWNELDMLECRLTELYDVVDKFILVECGETHQGRKKPSVYLENSERFRPWADKIEYVWVGSLKAHAPREKEHEQREYVRDGLDRVGTALDDIIIHSDIDEIPTVAVVQRFDSTLQENAWVSKIIVLDQRLFCFAVDWEHPNKWTVPTVARYKHIKSFNDMRNRRQLMGPATVLLDGGHHLSWLGDRAAHLAKIDAIYEGPEIASVRPQLVAGDNRRLGLHVDGVQMRPVEIDATWPRYVREKRCPKNWFRSYCEQEKDRAP